MATKLGAPNIIQVVICVLLGTFNDTLSGGTHMDETYYSRINTGNYQSDYVLIEIG